MFVSQSRYAQRTQRSRRDWMGLIPSKKLKNAIVKTFFSPGAVPLKPNPNHHRISDSSALELTAGRSVRKRARARSRSAQNMERPPLQTG